MPTSKNPNTYHDVEMVLQAARDNGGIRYELSSPKAAISWRRRAYTYRALLSDLGRQRANTPGFIPPTKWDDVHLGLDGSTVIIEFNKLGGQLKTLDGQPVEAKPLAPAEPLVSPPVADGDDPLLLAALEIMGDKE